MFANLPTWTTERVDLLKVHFEAGLSCREIAVSIGVSRNAVIGKLSRMNLTRRKPARERGARSVPRLQYQMLRALYDEELPVEGALVVSAQRCSLFELSKERCRWPISTP